MRSWLQRHLGSTTKALIKQRMDWLVSFDSLRSYSQRGEDAFLHSYFKGKTWTPSSGGGQFSPFGRGFYVDVGCYSPMQCSNTYLFYNNGWRGINVDPTPGVKSTFDRTRPRDINLQLAISRNVGETTFYTWGEPCVFNTISANVAEERTITLGKAPSAITVPVKPLSLVLDTYLPEGQGISFLTVDVEGHDEEVLRSNDWKKYRPELVVVENDSACIDELLGSSMHAFLSDIQYGLLAVLPPSSVYVDLHTRSNTTALIV